MQRKLIKRTHSVKNIIIIYTSIILLMLISSTLIMFKPISLGKLGINPTVDKVMRFESLYFNQGDLDIQFPHGGYIAPVYRHDQVTGVAVFGQGASRFNGQANEELANVLNPIDKCYIVMNHIGYLQLINELVLYPADQPQYASQALEMSSESRRSEVWFTPFATERFLPVPQNYHTALVSPMLDESEKVQNEYIVLSDTSSVYPQLDTMAWNILGYLSLYGLLFASTAILTAHYEPSYANRGQLKPRPLLLAALLSALILEVVVYHLQLPLMYAYSARGFAFVFFVYALVKAGTSWPQLRIYQRGWLKSIGTGTIAGVLMAALATLQWPNGLAVTNWTSWGQGMALSVVLPFFWLSFLMFGIGHSLIQSYASKWTSLILTAISTSFVLGFLSWIDGNTHSLSILLDSFIFMPLTLLLVGKLILDTDSILTGALALSIAVVLPQLFLF